MFFAALVSGGKDSCHALGAATAAGHVPLCLLNLAPADAGVDDADSYCFQTVGHASLDALAAATGLPLLRRALRGASVDTRLEYRGTETGDEVEDLAALVAAAQRRFPTLDAVVSGAVASDYQRLRVEAVCARLGLTSLAPLWRTGQAALLGEMAAQGTEAIIIKVASAGLDARHVGRTVASLTPHLLSIGAAMGVHPAGEGGEYESLALDCAAFRRARLAVADPGTVVSVGGGAYIAAGLRMDVVLKGGWEGGGAGEVVWVDDEAAPPPRPPAPAPPPSLPASLTSVRPSPAGWQVTATAFGDPATATAAALAAVDAALAGVCATGLRAAAHVRLYLPTMAAFPAANAAYAGVLPPLAPPARACVAAGLGGGVGAAVDVFVPAAASTRASLHVQSVSPWAPACIGPYAQAVTTDGAVVRCAGQIGLEPGSMDIVDGGPRAQAVRCWRSVDAVCVAVGASAAGGLLTATLYASEEAGVGGLADAAAATEAFIVEGAGGVAADAGGGGAYRDPYLARPPPPFPSPRPPPPLLYLIVPGLPRGAAVEVEPLVWRGGVATPPSPVRRGTPRGAALLAPATFCVVAAAGDDPVTLASDVAAALAEAGLADGVAVARWYVARGGAAAADGDDRAVADRLAAAWTGAGLTGPSPPPTWVSGVGTDAGAGSGVGVEVHAYGGGMN